MTNNKRLLLAALLAMNSLGTLKAIDTSVFNDKTLFIEAEDVDFGHGKSVTDKEIGMNGPYNGGSYKGLGTAADLDFDWHTGAAAPQDGSGDTYRGADTGLSAAKHNGSAGSDRGYFQVKDWWTLGWNSGGDWENYTRTFPATAQDYYVIGHLASGGAAINIELDQITAGVGQDDTQQVKKKLGAFNPGRATAGWDSLELFPLVDDNGKVTTVNLSGKVTLRAALQPGSAEDMDYFAFVPATGPLFEGVVATPEQISFKIDDAPNAALDASSVSLKLNGATLTANAPTAANGVTTFVAPAQLGYLSSNGLAITYKDKNGKSYTANASFTVTSFVTHDTVFIEAEDVDYDHGQFVTTDKIGMDGPYAGGAYKDLGSADDLDIDWHKTVTSPADGSSDYRSTTGLTAGKHNGSGGVDRGYFQVTDNWTLGWNNGGDWQNYTRNFPAKDQWYEGYAHLASGGAAINIELDQITSGAGQPDAQQVKKHLGNFAPGRATAGWDSLEIFPLLTGPGGSPTVVKLNGKTTLRLYLIPGAASDEDYIAFRPVTLPVATITVASQPKSVSIQEGSKTTLSVDASTTGKYGISYQWKKNSTAIAGANSPTLALPFQTLADTGASYTVDIDSPGAPAVVTSSAAVVTVTPDTTPPQVVSAGSLKTFSGGTEIGVIFDEALSGSTTTAVANYSLDNGATISAARWVTNSSGLDTRQQGVILTVSALNPSTTYHLSVKGVADAKGNAISTAQVVPVAQSSLTWLGVGPTVNNAENDAIATASNGFNLVNGGNAFWGNEDDITMAYETITGDFDKQAQVQWNDPSSNWARAGISARESLNNGQATTDASGANPASRYQMIIADPMTKFDGTAANDSFETNRRVDEGGATTSRAGGGNPNYPDKTWVRLKRVGNRISMFYSTDGTTWQNLGTTDYGDDTVTQGGPLKSAMFVGPTLGVENGNITGQGGTADQQGAFAARFRNYGDVPNVPAGTQAYSIGLNFGANEEGGDLSAKDVAGVPQVAQANWNNIFGNDTTVTPAGPIVADKKGASTSTPVTVDIAGSGNTWASEGPRGEDDNSMTGKDLNLMTGYLDTGNATTTQVTISKIPSDLTSSGYDVVLYALGGVNNRGGSYRVTDTAGATLADYVAFNAPANPTNYMQVGSDAANPANGNFIVFKNLKAANIIVEATTANGLGTSGTPRAPINAIQLVSPTGLIGSTVPVDTNQPTATITVTGSTLKVDSNPAGGTVQSTTSLAGPITWTDVGPAPQTVTPAPGAKFYRIKK